MFVFSCSFNNKSKSCGWNYANGLFICDFTGEAQKLPFIAVLIWFLILGQIQDGSQDGDHWCWRHRPPAAPSPIKYISSCWEDQRLFTKGKIVLKYCNISKSLGRGSINPPPPPCTTVGGWIIVYVRRLSCKCVSSPSFSVFFFFNFDFFIHTIRGHISSPCRWTKAANWPPELF